MLKDSPAFSSFSTNNLEEAKKFYGETLGLTVKEMTEMSLLQLDLTGGSKVVIYPKNNHEAATSTILNFPVANIDATVDNLLAKGVVFEQYDGFNQDEKGIARGPEGPQIAWFKDPAGNILSVLEDTDI